MAEWFTSWFDSPYYHTLYQHRDYQEAELFISSLLEYLNLPAGAKVADIPCGKGRHSIFLHSKGYAVTGVDLAPESIAEANLHAKNDLQFSVGDMRTISFHQEFDVVFNLFTSFGYFEDEAENKKALGNLVAGVNSRGKFIMDFMNVEKVLRVLIPSEEKIIDGIQFSIRRFVENNVLVKTIEVNDQGKQMNFQERVKVIRYSNLDSYLNSYGFKIVETFGSYDLDPFDPVNSERLIIIAERANE